MAKIIIADGQYETIIGNTELVAVPGKQYLVKNTHTASVDLIYGATTDTLLVGEVAQIVYDITSGWGRINIAATTGEPIAASIVNGTQPLDSVTTPLVDAEIIQASDSIEILGKTVPFVVDSIAALESLTGTKDGQVIKMTGYYAGVPLSDMPDYTVDVGSVLTPNGGSVIARSGGGCFVWGSFTYTDTMLFGADSTGVTSSKTAFENAMNSGAKVVTFPDGVFDVGTLYIPASVTLQGSRMPKYNPTADTLEKGSILKGIIALNSYLIENVKLMNFGVDATGETEGIVMSGTVATGKAKNIAAENIIVMGDATSNHCALFEYIDGLTIINIKTVKGVQGLAVKAENFFIDGSENIDASSNGFVLRESPSRPCRNGIANNILCRAVNLANAGGVHLMNDETGVEMQNVQLNNIIVDKGIYALYFNNGSNTTSMHDVIVNNLTVTNTLGFAVQTYGAVKACTLDGYDMSSTVGSLIINDATAEDLTFSNFQITGGAPALLKGNKHIARGWRRTGATPTYLIDNQSTNLQIQSFDQTALIASSGGGTVAYDDRKTALDVLYQPTIALASIGTIPAMTYNFRKSLRLSPGVMIQNDVVTLLSYSSVQRYVDIEIRVASPAGTHFEKVYLTNNTVTISAFNTSAGSVFELLNNGNNIDFKYKFATTGDVYISMVYTEFFNT